MIIDKTSEGARLKENDKRLNKPEDQIKDELLNNLRCESVSLITLAYYYAKNFEETGADLSKRWQTMQEQNALLQQVYNKGYEEGFYKGKAEERKRLRKQEQKEYPLGRNDWQE